MVDGNKVQRFGSVHGALQFLRLIKKDLSHMRTVGSRRLELS